METPTAIEIGSDEAARRAERIQQSEMLEDAQAPTPPQSEDVSDAEANRAIAEAWAMAMNAKAQADGYEHWACDEQEKGEVRDAIAPSVRELVPNRYLAKSTHIVAAGTAARIIMAKKAQDPE